MATLYGWVVEENLRAFVRIVAYIVGYELYSEDYDWIAIEYGLHETDADHDKWYTYPFEGKHALTLKVAQFSGAAVVNVRLTSDEPISPEVAAQWELLCAIEAEYALTHPYHPNSRLG